MFSSEVWVVNPVCGSVRVFPVRGDGVGQCGTLVTDLLRIRFERADLCAGALPVEQVTAPARKPKRRGSTSNAKEPHARKAKRTCLC